MLLHFGSCNESIFFFKMLSSGTAIIFFIKFSFLSSVIFGTILIFSYSLINTFSSVLIFFKESIGIY